MEEDNGTRHRAGNSAKRFGRRATLKLLGATLSGMVVRAPRAEADGSPPQAPGATRPPATRGGGRGGRAWRLRPLATGREPRAFGAAEFAALAAVVNLIIPDTDTPGARTAGVHWYLDDAGRTDTELRDQLAAGLRRLDARASARYGLPFAALAEHQQVSLLSALDGPDGATGGLSVEPADRPQVAPASPGGGAILSEDRSFLAFLKAQTIDAYYKSEMGQVGELEWIGHEFNDEFPGPCTHADPLVHPRARWPRTRA